LKFGTKIEVEGLMKLGNELIALDNIKENLGNRMFAEEFKGVTW